MKIKIYQIDMERDEHRIAMMGYEDTLARFYEIHISADRLELRSIIPYLAALGNNIIFFNIIQTFSICKHKICPLF